VYDARGRLIIQHKAAVAKGANTIAIPKSIGLTNGTYEVQVITSTDVITKKLVKIN
jgi:hypothetical protein